MARETDHARGPASPSRVRWGAVLAAAVITIALLTVLSTLWGALAYGTGVTLVEDNLSWFVGGSAIVATFLGGLVAGWLSGVPGAGVGALHGLTVWGLILVASMVVAVPGLVGTLGRVAFTPQVDTQATGEALWVTFLALLVGALAAVLGGAIGGLLTRPAAVLVPHTHETPPGPPGRRADEPIAHSGTEATTRVPSEPANQPSSGPVNQPSSGPTNRPSSGPTYQPVPPQGETRGGGRAEGGDQWPYVESDLR